MKAFGRRFGRYAALVSLVVLVGSIMPTGVAAAGSPGSQARQVAACKDTPARCVSLVLTLLNVDRQQYALPRLSLAQRQTQGYGTCPGSYGHSVAMAHSKAIWHSNDSYPRASFPRNICVRFTRAAENVGEASTGALPDDLQVLNAVMMKEPHGPGICAATINHACNILNPSLHHVGIGIYYGNGTSWLTEDFTD